MWVDVAHSQYSGEFATSDDRVSVGVSIYRLEQLGHERNVTFIRTRSVVVRRSIGYPLRRYATSR